MHGQYIRRTDRELISEEDRSLWLSMGDLISETEGWITAAQDLALQTKHHATKILQAETDSKCRFCQQFDDTVEHISACPILANEQYTDRYYTNLMCSMSVHYIIQKH
jgi:hypothetical protein